MCNLAMALLVLPYSTARVESLFSTLKLFKNPYRNRLSLQSLEASLITHQKLLESQKSTISNLIPTPNMKLRYENMWKKDSSSKVLAAKESSAVTNTVVPNNDIIKDLWNIIQQQQQVLQTINPNMLNNMTSSNQINAQRGNFIQNY